MTKDIPEHTSPPEWHPHDDPRYDEVLSRTSAAEVSLLRGGSTADRLAFLCDTRGAHARLYQELAPPDYPEYAGTYRGTLCTSLAGRRLVAQRLSDEEYVKFAEPAQVASHIANLNILISKNFAKHLPSNDVLEFAAKVFYFIGMTHPYLDGNGHIQRLVFLAIVLEHPDLELLPSWTIHPRPFAEDFALAYEEPTFPARIDAIREKLRGFVKVRPRP